MGPDDVILGSDLNIDLQLEKDIGNYIEDMCVRQQVKFGCQSVNANTEPTFVRSDGRIKSCI